MWYTMDSMGLMYSTKWGLEAAFVVQLQSFSGS